MAYDWAVPVFSIAGALLGWKLSPKDKNNGSRFKQISSSLSFSVLGLAIILRFKRDLVPPAYKLVDHNSMIGQTIVVTGGTTGLGLESVKALSLSGANVVLTARSDAKGEKAVAKVHEFLDEQGVNDTKDKIYAVQLDLDDLDNVKSFPKRLQKKIGDKKIRINVLMNNAGMIGPSEKVFTKDGYEQTFQSNHLGHFVLTAELAPYMTEDARIINVSSNAHKFVSKLDLDYVTGPADKKYNPTFSYGQSKLQNILFTKELQRRMDDTSSSNMTAFSCHPGVVYTDFLRNMVVDTSDPSVVFYKRAFAIVVQDIITKNLLRTSAQGAATQVYLAVAPIDKLHKSEFYVDKVVAGLPAYAKNMDDAVKLWETSEKLGGVTLTI